MGKTYEEVSEIILKGLESFEGFYSRESFFQFQEKILNMKKRIQDSMQEGRLLKIGIVGEVKAGKSSFLNALIFDGEDVLPKASTPMTAALTRITYSQNPSATIVFYTETDWERIVHFSQEYDRRFKEYYKRHLEQFNEESQKRSVRKIFSDSQKPATEEEMKRLFDKNTSLELRSCKELTEMFNESTVDLSSFLGKNKEIKIEDINRELKEYIGADGEYTPIVKHVELKMDNEILQTVEIVDTPGINDPIISRGQITKKFLGECDVVFLLSYSGQFLTQSDIMFMRETLPNEGVKNIVVVGSKFDSGILDDNKSTDIKSACQASIRTYNSQASENIRKCLSVGYNLEILKRIEDSLPPRYISSLLFSCAKKKSNRIPYSEQEQNIIEQLKSHFHDFEDEEKILLGLSGINQLKKEKIIPVMTSKKEIIDEKNREIISDNKKSLLKMLEDIHIEALQNKEDVEKFDKGQLEKKHMILETKLNSLRMEIKNIFENVSVESKKIINDMKPRIDEERLKFIDFKVDSYTHTEHQTVKTGFFRKEHYTKLVTTSKASISDVISNLQKYIIRCQRNVNEEFEKIVNLRKLEEDLKEAVLGAFDLSDKNFDEKSVLTALRIVIQGATIPEIKIDSSEYEKIIIEPFERKFVENDEIHELRLVLVEALEKLSGKIKEELDKSGEYLEFTIVEQSTSFVDKMIKHLTEHMENLKKQIDDKEESLKKYNSLFCSLREYKQLVNEMEI